MCDYDDLLMLKEELKWVQTSQLSRPADLSDVKQLRAVHSTVRTAHEVLANKRIRSMEGDSAWNSVVAKAEVYFPSWRSECSACFSLLSATD